MPIPTDYSSIVTEIGNYLQRSDLSAEIPTYLAYAEKRLGHDLRINKLVANTTVTVSANGNTGTLPTGFIGMVSVQVTGGGKLIPITIDTVIQADANANGMTVPVFYALLGDTIRVSPTWVSGGTLTVNYFKQETPLSGSNTTNWYVTNVSHMLMYAALLEAASFLRDVESMTKWQKYYEYARDRANTLYQVVDPYQRGMQMEAGKGTSLSPTV